LEVKTEPAGRLYDILQEGRTKPGDYPSRRVWASIFGVPEIDTGTILRMLAELIQLTYETKVEIEKLEDVDHQLYLRPFQRIESLFSQINLDAPWKHWKDQIDEPTIYGLQFCSDKLSRATNYTKIDNDEIEKIKNSLSELTDQVLETQLDSFLKQLLVRNLESLRQSLIAYRIKGIDGIQQEIELNLGSMVLHRDEIRQKYEHSKSGNLWKKYLSFLDGLNKTIAAAKNLKQIGGAEVLKLLDLNND
jgi:hypothetical protein